MTVYSIAVTQKTPTLTVITVVRNAAHEIEHTFRSIKALKTGEVEYIVLDGLSDDGTVALIQKYEPYIDYWRSASDKGLYDAMNQAIKLAHGRYVVHINAGDQLLCLPSALFGGADMAELYCACVATEDGMKCPEWNKSIYMHNTIPHQGCFYRRELLLAHPYDLRYRVFADYDLNLKLYEEGVRAVVSREVVAYHSVRGLSNQSRHARELFHIVRQHRGRRAELQSWLYFKLQGFRARWNRCRS